MFGIIVSVASLPAPHRDMTSLTAVRMRTENGIDSRFFVDSALAPTLKEGEWVHYEIRLAGSEWGERLYLVPLEFELHTLAIASSAIVVYGWLESLRVIIERKYPRLASEIPVSGGQQQFAEDLLKRIATARKAYELKSGEYCLPDEVMFSLLPGWIQAPTHEYLEILKAQLR